LEWGGGDNTRVMTGMCGLGGVGGRGGRDIIQADFAPHVGARWQEIVLTGAGMDEMRVRGCVTCMWGGVGT
jgi:hypothetical protein